MRLHRQRSETSAHYHYNSIKATALLNEKGECYFELTKDGAILKPVAFGSRSCNDNEQKFHSFVGEVA